MKKTAKVIGGLAGIVMLTYVACASPVPTPASIPQAQIPTPTATARPTATPTPWPSVEHIKYKIEHGDSLWKIYEMCCNIAPEGYENVGFNNFVQALKVIKRNGITDLDLIREGKELYIHVAQIRPDMLEGMRKKYGEGWISIEEINSGTSQIRSGTIIDKPVIKPVINMHRGPRNIETVVGQQAMKNYSVQSLRSRAFSHVAHAYMHGKT